MSNNKKEGTAMNRISIACNECGTVFDVDVAKIHSFSFHCPVCDHSVIDYNCGGRTLFYSSQKPMRIELSHPGIKCSIEFNKSEDDVTIYDLYDAQTIIWEASNRVAEKINDILADHRNASWTKELYDLLKTLVATHNSDTEYSPTIATPVGQKNSTIC